MPRWKAVERVAGGDAVDKKEALAGARVLFPHGCEFDRLHDRCHQPRRDVDDKTRSSHSLDNQYATLNDSLPNLNNKDLRLAINGPIEDGRGGIAHALFEWVR